MKTNEIAGVGNHNMAQFWEYDTRTARRWNVDPVIHPWESSFSVMESNPIWHNDVLGNTAERVVDNASKTVTYKANIYLYGDIDNKTMNEVYANAKKSFDEILNTATGKTEINGEEYTVKFDVKLFSVSKDEAKKLASENKSLANNFVRVEDNNRTSFFWRNGNDGIFTTGDVIGKNKNRTTVVHEFFHSLGLNHPSDDYKIDFDGKNKKLSFYQITEPRIIAPRGFIIKVVPFVYINQKFIYRFLDPNERRVTREDIKEAEQERKNQKLTNKIHNSYDLK
ncbi:hypothetical protein ACTHGU_03635 [Chitinophagaceae bacterium MMS25-I14]